MTQVNIHIAKVQKALLGEEVIIARDNKPMVKLVAIRTAKRKRTIGSAKGLVTISADFNEPLDDFKDYEK
jgi:antitoxin (DNA-binding transcriptional repressor) of toxin-antitoxin stability system